MLTPGELLSPFSPMAELRGWRSALPSDLTHEQLDLLAKAAPTITATSLRARVADVVWLYGDRSRVDMLDLAIDAYRAAPLSADVWFATGKVAHKRALERTKLRGKAGARPRGEIIATLQDWVLASTIADRFMVADCANMLRETVRMDDAEAGRIADHLIALATQADPALSRGLELEAAAWLPEAHAEKRNGCIERAARTYITEADTRVASDPKMGPLVAGHFLEDAIKYLNQLPRSYRATHGLDVLLSTLNARLVESRQIAVESMMRFESEPVDLSNAASIARQQVAGFTDSAEALAQFAQLMPPMDAARTRSSAETLVSGSLSRLFGSSTFSADGRKVAARPGSADSDEEATWAAVVQTVMIHAQVATLGLILPAREVLLLEHRYDRDFLTRVCAQSPLVPDGHARLWGAGLALGLDGEFGLAAAILVPQLEQLVRRVLKRNGVHTLFVDPDTRVESEKSLNSLLEMPEAEEALGSGFIMELQALLIDQSAANLRNEIAHGLFDDRAAVSYEAIYMWWFCLRLAVWSWWQVTRPNDDAGSEPTAEDDGLEQELTP
jgi:hypothetical protein